MHSLRLATFAESLLLCRGTLRTVTCGALNSVAKLVPRSLKNKWPALQLCLAHEAPTCTEPMEPELTADGRISRTVVTRVPVHWTLERLVVHERGSPPMADMLRLIAFCPKLQEFSAHVDGPSAFFRSSHSEVAFTGRVLYRSRAVLLSSAHRTEPVSRRRPNAKRAVVEQQRRSQQQAGPQRTEIVAPSEQLALMKVAHWYARCVLSTFKADPSVLPPGLSQHRAPLQRIVSTGEYPTALLWALCRGPEHTALSAVHIDAPIMTAEDAAALAAVVALAARMRRVERRRQHAVPKTVKEQH